MSASVSSPSIYSLQNNATRNVANHSAMLALPLLDQPLIVGPDFLPVPAKLVAQIVAGKYINLSALLVVNLMQRGPESQLLFDGRLVLTSQPKKKTHRGLCFMDGGLCHLFRHLGLSLSEPLERSHAVPVADPEELLPFFLVEFGSHMIKLSMIMPPLRGSLTGLLCMSNCSTFIQPVHQPAALLWSPRMTCPSCQVPPRPLFIANPAIRGILQGSIRILLLLSPVPGVLRHSLGNLLL